MTLEELSTLIHRVDARNTGCSVEITTICVPDHKRGMLYGTVKLGGGRGQSTQFTFTGEDELRDLLEGWLE